MAYIGKKPAEVALTASDITDGIITKAKLDSSIDAINYKNILINGDMQIAQRGTSFARSRPSTRVAFKKSFAPYGYP